MPILFMAFFQYSLYTFVLFHWRYSPKYNKNENNNNNNDAFKILSGICSRCPHSKITEIISHLMFAHSSLFTLRKYNILSTVLNTRFDTNDIWTKPCIRYRSKYILKSDEKKKMNRKITKINRHQNLLYSVCEVFCIYVTFQ